MATLTFSPLIERYISCPPFTISGDSIKEVLDAYFVKHRRVRDYILDESGRLRPKLAIFINGVLAQDRIRLSDPVHANAQIFVFAQLDCDSND